MMDARGLAKAFGAVQAVTDVSFRAEDGRITGLLGPNGAGKTTTLRMLYSLLQPDRGEVHVDGVSAQRAPQVARRRMGVLPDTRGLYRRLTARENIEYFGMLQGLEPAVVRARTGALIERLDLRDFADRATEGFSQGQRVKTAIARALVHDPQNVLLDEPTNGLDVLATRAMRELMRQLRAEGKCILFSSHLMPEVAALCDHIVVVAQAVPEDTELAARPKDGCCLRGSPGWVDPMPRLARGQDIEEPAVAVPLLERRDLDANAGGLRDFGHASVGLDTDHRTPALSQTPRDDSRPTADVDDPARRLRE